VVKEFDPLDATLIGETDAARREPTPVAGLYAGRYQIERLVGRGGWARCTARSTSWSAMWSR
jgi:hypothetical protein